MNVLATSYFLAGIAISLTILSSIALDSGSPRMSWRPIFVLVWIVTSVLCILLVIVRFYVLTF